MTDNLTIEANIFNEEPRMLSKINNRCLFGSGIFQLILAVSILACGVAAYITLTYLHLVSHGIWAGLFGIVAAGLAIKTGLTDPVSPKSF